MKQYVLLAISFIQFQFGLLFWDSKRLEEFLHAKFIMWHGPGFRFWYYKFHNSDSDLKEGSYYVLTKVEDCNVVFYYLNKGTYTRINDSDREYFNPSLFHFDNSDKRQRVVSHGQYQYTVIKNSYLFKHYMEYTDIDVVIERINYKSIACATGGVLDYIISKSFVRSFIPIYCGKIYYFYRRK